MKRLLLPFVVLATLSLVPACRSGGEEGGHAHGEEAHDHSASHKAHEEIPSRAVTIFTSKSELFAEHRFLVAGDETPFAAHLTNLKDYSPVSEGRMEVILTGKDDRKQKFAVEGVARPGIFRPVAKPDAAGTYRMTFRVVSQKLTDTIDAGEVTVYPDVAQAIAAAPPEEANPDEISFLKEQQWKIPFGTQLVQQASLEEGISLQGSVKPAGGREVAIAAPSPGRIVVGRGRLPQLGDKVGKGEDLAILTPVEASGRDRAGLNQAVTEADATLRQAKLDLSRAERLFAAQAVPAKRVEEARTSVTIAEASLAAARRQLAAKLASLDGGTDVTGESYRLKAPIAGTIVEVKLVPGSFVEAGAPLYRIVDLDSVWVEARAAEVDLNRLAGAKRAEIAVPGSDPVTVGQGRGRLVTIGSVLDPSSRTAPVVYAVPNADGRFRIGMTAEVRVLTGPSKPGPLVPRSAVVDDNGKAIAYVQTGGESFERRELELGVKQGERVQVKSGLAAGERVVSKGGYEIRLTTLSDSVPAHGHEH